MSTDPAVRILRFKHLEYNLITSCKDCQMNVALEHLSLLPEILEKLKLIEKNLANFETKRWLNVKEVGNYLGYSVKRSTVVITLQFN